MLSKLEDLGANGGIILVVLGIIAIGAAFFTLDVSSSATVKIILITSPVWLPVITFGLFYEYWLEFVRREFDLKQGRVTLEIRIPQEVFKSPEVMELILNQLHQTAAPDNHIQTYWDGKHPPVTSLEIVSRGGDVRFYINVPRKKFKNIAEAGFYSQYPGVEMIELDVDYTSEIPWDPSRFSYFSLHFNLKKDDALPLKTYIEYGMHTMPKEEEKIDPITTMLEPFAAIGPGEYFWAQILIDANRDVGFKEGSLTKQSDWKPAANAFIQKMIADAQKRAGENAGGNVMQQLTDTEKDTIKAVERSLGKNAFNVAIRGMYIATNEAYTPGERIGSLITSWRGYDDINRNALGVRWRTDYDWNWWQDPSGRKKQAWKKDELREYKLRSYSQRGAKDGKKIMTTEELATIFHIPGKVVTTPTVGRIPSTRSEAPPNLPIAS
ncbi:hypothetical protein GW943_01195 [Candidatus Parcubacteria bacterium]|uniref:DUF8128 domain-containing protein n=1 Tax=Candidatus Kaiserbacteria bacterium CG10_big_fil_rev_8_21_14_0_10_47_16 TaxID=1974608 RepID=A0A2H0UDG8_9BACT|nr:hypothetical protein [Candidatus Parcubacteria bacterium]PIR84442.1 MAG: hypothetical protein COU16_02575 [Candidatus Kaiserbacteria bacterium CG10_big_fil_rev_8_21_14_0_10_47_16]